MSRNPNKPDIRVVLLVSCHLWFAAIQSKKKLQQQLMVNTLKPCDTTMQYSREANACTFNNKLTIFFALYKKNNLPLYKTATIEQQ